MATKKPKGKLPDRPVAPQELNNPGMHDLSHARDNRCIPVAFEVIKEIAKMEKFYAGSHVNTEDANKAYLPAIYAVMKKMVDDRLLITDMSYVFSLVRQSVEAIESAIDETLNQNMNRVTELVYGLDHNKHHEITLKQLESVVARKDKLQGAWKPVLEAEIKTEE